jgi:LmbE family N-acetylglucosaminyl deacetylase
VSKKRAAASMHRSQFGENSMWAKIPEDLAIRFNGEERFYRARPNWDASEDVQEGLDGIWALAKGS